MWFYPLLLALVILAIVGGTLAGGIFTIVLGSPERLADARRQQQ